MAGGQLLELIHYPALPATGGPRQQGETYVGSKGDRQLKAGLFSSCSSQLSAADPPPCPHMIHPASWAPCWPESCTERQVILPYSWPWKQEPIALAAVSEPVIGGWREPALLQKGSVKSIKDSVRYLGGVGGGEGRGNHFKCSG